ncbi:phospholipase D-like domain-containing protein [Bifidobacterium choloepi]|uniref:Phospholipase D-like domain-containing protein n=1 Tax=Bifidobacterium choloepi TaxID=2614131 RepID=A0A6I5N2P5_9BIFI|nr:hypothetical protein [Bifidobacterium choloepi]NEG69929.1 hypothetical protein [Bifidobacterium choloepi]
MAAEGSIPANRPTTPTDPAATDDATASILQDVLTGFITPQPQATGNFAPALIANSPTTSTMADSLSEEITHSDSFDMPVAFVSPGAVQSLLQDFYDHRDAGGRTSRIITSTKNYFNSPRAFWQLLHLQKETGIEVRVWSDSNTSNDSSVSSLTPSSAGAGEAKPSRWESQPTCNASNWSNANRQLQNSPSVSRESDSPCQYRHVKHLRGRTSVLYFCSAMHQFQALHHRHAWEF